MRTDKKTNYYFYFGHWPFTVQKIAYHEANVRDLITTTLRVKKAPTSDVMPDVCKSILKWVIMMLL